MPDDKLLDPKLATLVTFLEMNLGMAHTAGMLGAWDLMMRNPEWAQHWAGRYAEWSKVTFADQPNLGADVLEILTRNWPIGAGQ